MTNEIFEIKIRIPNLGYSIMICVLAISMVNSMNSWSNGPTLSHSRSWMSRQDQHFGGPGQSSFVRHINFRWFWPDIIVIKMFFCGKVRKFLRIFSKCCFPLNWVKGMTSVVFGNFYFLNFLKLFWHFETQFLQEKSRKLV